MQKEYQGYIPASLTLTQAEYNSLTFTTSHPTSVPTSVPSSVPAPTPPHMAFLYVHVCLLYQMGGIHLGNHNTLHKI